MLAISGFQPFKFPNEIRRAFFKVKKSNNFLKKVRERSWPAALRIRKHEIATCPKSYPGKSNLEAIKRWLDTEYDNLTTEFDPLNARKVSDILALNLARNMPSHILGE